MEIRKIAESIVDGLSNLENRTKTIQKMAYSYKEKQLEIVFNHLRHLTSRSSRAAGACDCPKPTILEKSYCTQCGRDIHPPPA